MSSAGYVDVSITESRKYTEHFCYKTTFGLYYEYCSRYDTMTLRENEKKKVLKTLFDGLPVVSTTMHGFQFPTNGIEAPEQRVRIHYVDLYI